MAIPFFTNTLLSTIIFALLIEFVVFLKKFLSYYSSIILKKIDNFFNFLV